MINDTGVRTARSGTGIVVYKGASAQSSTVRPAAFRGIAVADAAIDRGAVEKIRTVITALVRIQGAIDDRAIVSAATVICEVS